MQRNKYPIIINDYQCCGPDSTLTPVAIRIEIYEINSITFEKRVSKCERFRPQVSNPNRNVVITNVCLDGVNLDGLTEEAFSQLKRCPNSKILSKY